MKKETMDDILVMINFFGSIFASAIAFVAVHKAWMKIIGEPEITLFDLL